MVLHILKRKPDLVRQDPVAVILFQFGDAARTLSSAEYCSDAGP